jgi:AcrR family transcriptional regulator
MPSQVKLETISSIKDAFWDLYEHKALAEISVKEITNAAGYNRGTFYLYFDNTSQVLAQIEDDVIEQIIGERSLEEMLMFLLIRRPLEEEIESFSGLFEKHKRFLLALFGDRGDPAFARKLKSAIKAKLIPEVKHMTVSTDAVIELTLEYILSAEIGLLTYIFGDMKGVLPSEEDFSEAFSLVHAITSMPEA